MRNDLRVIGNPFIFAVLVLLLVLEVN